MLKILCFMCCLLPLISSGQTTHSVSVIIGQETGCPEPLNIASDTNLFEVFPNPAKETITILTKLDHFEVRMYTLQGELVLKSYQSGQEELDVRSLAEGIYLLEVHTDFHSESRRIKIKR